MAWSTPKTDWESTDYYNYDDINRWKDNLHFIHEYAENLFCVTIDEATMYSTKDYTSYPLASEMNALESNLESINAATYNLDIGTTQTYSSNGYTVAYDEINRIESYTLQLYYTLKSEKSSIRRLEFRLGGATTFQVPRSTYRPFNLVMAWRLGDDKTFLVPRGTL